ncbi:MAG: hypothetical protein A2X49_13885 [Lentisphaerae bacterium GWF2_52_8]|nr:MAG: hypothetical protein A2X49_13885 [Lentisphaerae bacterium GWF2_52_8]
MLTPEWKRRLELWRKVMTGLFYQAAVKIDFEGFVTKEQLSPEEAMKRSFAPMPAGTAWGAKWDYAWFRANITIPRELAGKRIAMRIKDGCESTVFLNGISAGGNTVNNWDGIIDMGAREITLLHKAKGGEKFQVLVEGYAGHGPRVCGGGPLPHGEKTIPETPATQVKMEESSFGIWNEDMYQLWLDTDTLMQLRDSITDQGSLLVAELDESLMEMSLAVDLEAPPDELSGMIAKGRAILKKALGKHNGSSAPFMSCFGHSHIDVAWLWPLQETERKCCRTFGSQLALMKEYPEYKYLQSQPHVYQMVRKRYPELYSRIKDAVKRGQWLPEGGMWVESDTNVPSGESLIRQFLHGKRFFKDEFGVDSRMLWLPDVFGYSAAMPQIMAGCGVEYFSTQKIFWTYNGGDPFPYNLFWWVGLDGTQVMAYIHNDYNSNTFPAAVAQRWQERVDKSAWHKGRLMPFGHGDGGGGPTRNHLEYLRREKNLEGLPCCKIENPLAFFKQAERKKIPSWVGELYFQAHRGTYTTQAKTKLGNRKSEFALREAELWGAAAEAIKGLKFPLEKAGELWRGVLLNQFHDIIPGSSIQRVYEEAEALYAKVISGAAKITKDATTALAPASKDSLCVFNSLSWKRDVLLSLPPGFEGAEDAEGNALEVQKCGAEKKALLPAVPACGWTSIRNSAAAKPAKTTLMKVNASLLENDLIRVKLNKSGEIMSVFDKESKTEFMDAPGNKFRLYKDIPGAYDAWDIDSIYKEQEVQLKDSSTVKVYAEGPLFVGLRVERKISNSVLTQEITLRKGSRRIEFKTRVDWREKHRMLKVCFPLNVHTEDALHEIQFGHIRRPTHDSKPYDATRFEVCAHKWSALAEESRGAAVLNDCKYGVSAEDNSINLTLLRAPLAPDMNAEQGSQEFTYALYVWNGPLRHSGLLREAYELNVPALAINGAAKTGQLLSLDADNLIVEAIKPAEDGSGDLIVRIYEAMRSETQATLLSTLPIVNAKEADMLENPGKALKLANGKISLKFRPFEIKTLRLKIKR